MVEIPGSLVQRLRTRQAALITGLGCSELVGAPGWIALTEWLAGRLVFSDARATVARLVAAGRLADANALIRDMLPHPILQAAIREAFPEGGPIPESIQLVAGFPWRAVVTTSFGDLWERALRAAAAMTPMAAATPDPGQAAVQVLVGSGELDPPRAGGAGTSLMHLFGRVALPESLCLGPADARTRLAMSGGLAWLDELARRRSLVFVGFRPSDPDLDWLAGWLSSRAGGDAPHFLFLDVSAEADPDTEVTLLALRTGLQVIPCLAGTAAALDRLARLANEIGPSLPPSDADVDLDAWLGRWAQDPSDPQPREVLARAEAALREDERWDRLIELHLRRLDLQEDDHERRVALKEVARIFRDVLATPHRALTAGIAALRLAPDDDQLWKELRADARAAGAWDELVADAAAAARAAGATPQAARIWREIASLSRHELGRPDAALAAYRDALAAEPAHPETRDGQAELLRELGLWAELVSVLKATASETQDPARAAALMLEAAEVLEGRFGDPAGAIAACEAALVMAPGSESTATMLERLYEGEKRWGDLAALLERRADRLPEPRAAELRRRRVEILVDHLDALDIAARELESLLESEPADRALLERLEGIYLRAERRDDHLRTLRRRAELALHPAERLAILRTLAAEGQATPEGLERAAEALERILELEPRDPDAFPALARIYRTLGRWGALLVAQARRLVVTETAEARRELLLGQAEIYERELDDPQKALDAYAAALGAGADRDPRREEIYEAMARLSERLARWDLCVEALAKWGETAAEPELRAALLVQAGIIFHERLGDLPAADSQLRAALEIEPRQVRALAQLARVQRDRGELEKAAETFVEAAAHEESPGEMAELYTEAALLVADKLAQESRAVDLLTRALAADPGHVPASERLVAIYSAHKEWAEVEALLDIQARHAAADVAGGGDGAGDDAVTEDGAGDAVTKDGAGDGARDDDRQLAIQIRLAGACLELGKIDKALGCLEAAHARWPESLELLRPYAKLRLGRGDWKQAHELYASILRLHRQALPAEEALEIVMALGRCEGELGNLEQAIRHYGEARALAPGHRPALEALCALHASRKDWRAWVDDRQELVAIAAADERAGLWEEIGDACAERLGDSARAEESYRAALAAEPGRRQALDKLLDLYTKDERWQPAADTLAELARLETTPVERAKTLYRAALVARDGLHAPAQAVALLERCLDDTRGMTEAFVTKAFGALEALHKSAGDWKALGASYRWMLERLPEGAPKELRHGLWSRLADLALGELDDRKLAITALEAATELAPDDSPRQAALAGLYETSGPDARAQAIAAHQRLLANDPDRLDSYVALARLFGEIGEIDKQWCVAAALCFLNRADPATEGIFKRHRPPGVRVPKHSFSEEVWQRVRHPHEDPLLDDLFALTALHLAAPAAQAPQSFGLRRRQRIDFATDASLQSRALIQLSHTMGLPRPELFVMGGETGQTALLNVREKGQLKPTLLLGPATMRRASFDLIFELTSHMAFLRPERYLKIALATPAALDFGLRVTLALAGSAAGGAGPNGEAGRLVEHLRRTVPPAAAAELIEAGRKLMARGQAVDIAKWAAATDLSAARTALLLTGDLGAAARVIASEPIPTSSISVRKRMADLVAFSASEDYFACRKQLGLHVA